MEIETLNIKPAVSSRYRSFNASSFLFDLPGLVDNMKHSRSWIKGELISMILFKNQDKKIVLTVLHNKTKVNSFQSNGSITFQIIEGKIQFHTKKEEVILNKGQLLTLHEKVKYSLTTLKETVFLITIANSTLIVTRK